METRLLGRTGLRVSVFGIGTWQLGGPCRIDGKADGYPDLGHHETVRLIQECADLGINLIDTAPVYGDGNAERRVGDAIKGTRANWILCTKFGLGRGMDGKRVSDTRPNAIRSSLEASLRRLATDYVDIFLYHSSPCPKCIEFARDSLEDLKREGKLRRYGISTKDPSIVNAMASLQAVDVVLFGQSLLTHALKMRKIIEQQQLGGMVRGALEMGRLSGKYFRTVPTFKHDDIRRHLFRNVNFEKYAAFEQLLPEGMTMPIFALRYLLDFDTTHSIIIGGKSVKDYQQAVQAQTYSPLSTETHALATSLGKSLTPKYKEKTVLLIYTLLSKLKGLGHPHR